MVVFLVAYVCSNKRKISCSRSIHKNLIRNKSGSIEDRAVKFAWFSDMAD